MKIQSHNTDRLLIPIINTHYVCKLRDYHYN